MATLNQLRVYYNNMKLSELLKQANLSHDFATDENFTLKTDGTDPIDLFQPSKVMTSGEVLEEFKKNGEEPGRIEHILQYAIKHPKNDEGINYIGALGSIHRGSDGYLRVPVLLCRGGLWVLSFDGLDFAWRGRDRIARCKSELGSSDTREIEGTRTLGPLGIELRDYFAMAALTGLLSTGGKRGHLDGNGDDEENAQLAFKYADAMLKERAKDTK